LGVQRGIEGLRRDLADLRRALQAALSPPEEAFPRELFHYTQTETCLPILRGSHVRATNALFMNDAAELVHAHEVYGAAVETLAEGATGALRRALDIAAGIVGVAEMGVDVYVFSLTEDGNQLSQWREYAAKGTGVSIGFDAGALRASAARDPSLAFLRAVYDPGEQDRLLGRHVRDACEAFARNVEDKGDDGAADDVLRGHLSIALGLAQVAFKYPGFREEREWRVAHLRPNGDASGLGFRATANAIVPYVELDLTSAEEPYRGRLPVTTIYQGPQAMPGLGERSLGLLLAALGYHPVAIRSSGIPLRS
jgi:hypothetical protein